MHGSILSAQQEVRKVVGKRAAHEGLWKTISHVIDAGVNKFDTRASVCSVGVMNRNKP